MCTIFLGKQMRFGLITIPVFTGSQGRRSGSVQGYVQSAVSQTISLLIQLLLIVEVLGLIVPVSR